MQGFHSRVVVLDGGMWTLVVTAWDSAPFLGGRELQQILILPAILILVSAIYYALTMK
jgi:hypothetical protein